MSNQLNHFLADNQLNKSQLLTLIELAIKIKKNPTGYNQDLAGKSVAMIFEKPSLRTHVSFDMGISKLGGHALYLGQQNGKLGERERVSDYAKNLSCFADAIDEKWIGFARKVLGVGFSNKYQNSQLLCIP